MTPTRIALTTPSAINPVEGYTTITGKIADDALFVFVDVPDVPPYKIDRTESVPTITVKNKYLEIFENLGYTKVFNE